jgi:small-conductance mechanosensitive channel
MDWTPVTDWLLQHGIRILIIIVLALIIYFIIRMTVPKALKPTLQKTMKGMPKVSIEKRTNTLNRLFIGATGVVITIIAAFLILAEVGINITALIAGLGVVGIAVGFGAQHMVKDLIAGFFILFENQYNMGDVIKVAGVSGIVEMVNLRRTQLRDLDGILHTIPNGEISVASNLTKVWSRAHLNISVAYKEDLDRVMSLLKKVWEETANDPTWGEFIISKTPSFLRVDDFGDSGITVKLAGETQPIKQWDVMGELRRRIKRTFDEEGIEIPWPHTKLYFGNSPEQAAAADEVDR